MPKISHMYASFLTGLALWAAEWASVRKLKSGSTRSSHSGMKKRIMLDDIGFIHCDSQGSENFIFSRAVDTIKKYKPVLYYENNEAFGRYLYDNVCSVIIFHSSINTNPDLLFFINSGLLLCENLCPIACENAFETFLG